MRGWVPGGGLSQLAIWVHLHGLTSKLVLGMRAGAGPLGSVEFCHRTGRQVRSFWRDARELCALPGEPLWLEYGTNAPARRIPTYKVEKSP